MYLRVALTEQCNLRCTYCLPEQADLRPGSATSEELQGLISAVVAVAGVKIRYTGGELTSHGRLHTCLFDETGLDLLTPLRDGHLEAVHRRIRAAVRRNRLHLHSVVTRP